MKPFDFTGHPFDHFDEFPEDDPFSKDTKPMKKECTKSPYDCGPCRDPLCPTHGRKR